MEERGGEGERGGRREKLATVALLVSPHALT